MSYTQSRVLNANYYVVERFNETDTDGARLRTIRVSRAESRAFFDRFVLAAQEIFSNPALSPQNVSICYTDLIRHGILREFLQTFVQTPADTSISVSQTAPLTVPDNTRAFVHFENAAQPTYLDLFFYAFPLGMSSAQEPFTFDVCVRLNHTIISGPLNGVAYTGTQPAVPTEPPAPPPVP
jgi:hypothetical protein